MDTRSGCACYQDSVDQSFEVDDMEIELDEGVTTLYSCIYALMMLVCHMIEFQRYCSPGQM